MEIVTVKEVAELLKVKEKTIYQWAELGQIPCMKLNGSLRFDIEDVKQWIQGCKKEADSVYNPLYSRQRSRKGVRKINGTV